MTVDLEERLRAVEDRALVLEETSKGIKDALDRIFGKLSEISEGKAGYCIGHTVKLDAMERRLSGLTWIVGVIGVALIGAFIGHVLSGH